MKIKLPKNKKKSGKQKNKLTRCGRQTYVGTHSVRDVLQCKSNTKKKKRCRKRTAHTSKCWIHLANEDNLRIKPSNIKNAGKGLFSWKKPFKRNQFINEYTGEKTTLKKLNNKYGKNIVAQYSICDGPKKCWDAYKTTDGPPRFANDARGTKNKNNSCFRVKNKKITLESTKSIKPNQEIYADYGGDYWPKHMYKK